MQTFDRNKPEPTDNNLKISKTVSVEIATAKLDPDAFNERRALREKQAEHPERWDGLS